MSTIPEGGTHITAVTPALSLETGATEAPPLTPRPAGLTVQSPGGEALVVTVELSARHDPAVSACAKT
jgi:hypothetical protein